MKKMNKILSVMMAAAMTVSMTETVAPYFTDFLSRFVSYQSVTIDTFYLFVPLKRV